ncbi:hypothetical protein RRG08_000065, partial [Elysia crispata]
MIYRRFSWVGRALCVDLRRLALWKQIGGARKLSHLVRTTHSDKFVRKSYSRKDEALNFSMVKDSLKPLVYRHQLPDLEQFQENRKSARDRRQRQPEVPDPYIDFRENRKNPAMIFKRAYNSNGGLLVPKLHTKPFFRLPLVRETRPKTPHQAILGASPGERDSAQNSTPSHSLDFP